MTIDADKGEFHLAALKASNKPDAIKILKDLIEGRFQKTDLADIIDFASRIPISRVYGQGATCSADGMRF